mgnify:CR=1 FL=1|jgi:hypothetical protein
MTISMDVAQQVALHSLTGEPVDVLSAQHGFLGHRPAPICSVGLHPLKLIMAVGTVDGTVVLYATGQSAAQA